MGGINHHSGSVEAVADHERDFPDFRLQDFPHRGTETRLMEQVFTDQVPYLLDRIGYALLYGAQVHQGLLAGG
ncbi:MULTISPECIES: hypothetical protein [Nocardia]|uniref:hypothetical protein n=1 Tax=Nocardia TaxID=1817 RepID=UPI002456D925|nr:MULTISPECIES: hypothetical protein [Nocardia]